jgi:hypothetical protein
MTASEKRHCITERETPYGYWWRYTHSQGEPENTFMAATAIAASVAADQAQKHGKTYFVSISDEPSRAVYIFACDHPDARNPTIHTALEIMPTGERISRNATRH